LFGYPDTHELYTLSLHDALPISLAGTLNGKQATVGGASLGLEFGKVAQAALAAEIRRRVADSLDAQCPTLFQVLLDAGMLIKHVDRKSTRLNSSHDQISYAVFCL